MKYIVRDHGSLTIVDAVDDAQAMTIARGFPGWPGGFQASYGHSAIFELPVYRLEPHPTLAGMMECIPVSREAKRRGAENPVPKTWEG